jgi:Tfp pilus assembly protein PilF
LRLGLSAYQSQSFQVAAEHLEKAVRLDPTSIEAHLYLGHAYNEIYCPTCDFDVESAAAANDRWRLLAMEQYLSVLQLDPANTDALNNLAYRYYWHAERDKAQQYYHRTIRVSPNNVEALYNLAVLQWQASYQLRMEQRLRLGHL